MGDRKTMGKHRLYHSFEWKAVIDVITDKTKGSVLIADAGANSTSKIATATQQLENKRVFHLASDIYDNECVDQIIRAANSTTPEDLQDALSDLTTCEVIANPANVTVLVLVDHPY